MHSVYYCLYSKAVLDKRFLMLKYIPLSDKSANLLPDDSAKNLVKMYYKIQNAISWFTK